MRLVGVDFGGARIGLATMESEFAVGRTLPFLPATGTLAKDAAAIHAIAKAEGANEVVIGVPLIEGAETKMSRICRMLGDELKDLGWAVHYCDESLTSVGAESELLAAGLKASQIKRSIDSEAALRILERFVAEGQ
ncbi:MAG: Holliday junction resolvase RuvX [Fimbriimonadaceae bacterium]|nr:Holliday junction resolvase RuvX [Fimbriimonadaceae bacterium]